MGLEVADDFAIGAAIVPAIGNRAIDAIHWLAVVGKVAHERRGIGARGERWAIDLLAVRKADDGEQLGGGGIVVGVVHVATLTQVDSGVNDYRLFRVLHRIRRDLPVGQSADTPRTGLCRFRSREYSSISLALGNCRSDQRRNSWLHQTSLNQRALDHLLQCRPGCRASCHQAPIVISAK